jgi:hypothetical protein
MVGSMTDTIHFSTAILELTASFGGLLVVARLLIGWSASQ